MLENFLLMNAEYIPIHVIVENMPSANSLANCAPVISSIAAVVTAGMAIWGICAWKREYVGKRRIDLAEKVLELVYEVRDIFKAIRSPLGHQNEGLTRKNTPEETDKEKSMLDTAYIQVERCNAHQDLFAQLYSLRYRFMAQYGEDKGELIEKLYQKKFELLRPSRKMLLGIKNLRKKIKPASNPDGFEKGLDKIWDEEWPAVVLCCDDNGDDPLLEEVEEIVKQIEDICRETIGL